MSSRIVLFAACAIALAFGPGCTSLTKDKATQKDSPWEAMQFWKKGYQQPQKMAVLWSHDVLTVAGKPPTRGFGGRIYFYNNKSQAIPVEGELVIHGFDETAKKLTGAPDNQADKRFRFTQEQFTSHYSESDLGASYSIWVPWDTADGVQKEITLVPTFKSSQGELVQGDPAKVVLPGRKKPEDHFTTPVQTVSYQQSTNTTANGQLQQVGPKMTENKTNGMRTTTIQLGSASSKNGRPHNAAAIAAATPTAASSAPLATASPATATALDQARAKLIEDAFRQAQPAAERPAPTYSAWTPSNVPMSGATAAYTNNLTPAGWPAGKAPSGAATPAGPTSQVVPASAVGAPHSDEGYALPPGVQLSPRGTAW